MRKHLLYSLLLLSPSVMFAQSTFGTILGNVKDNSGAAPLSRHTDWCFHCRRAHYREAS